MPRAAPGIPDFRAVFEASPTPALVLAPDLTVVAVNDAYLHATMAQREALVGRSVLAAFPDDPDDPAASFARNLRASLDRVLSARCVDQMAAQKRDLRRPPAAGGVEERYWSALNIPVAAPDGKVAWIIHQVDDVTGLVLPGAAGAAGETRVGAPAEHPPVSRDAERAILSAVIEHLPIGVGLCDANGQIILSNPALRKFVGAVIPSRDAEWASRWHGFDSEGRPIAPADFPPARALRGETVIPGTEFRYADGTVERWTRVGSVPLRDADGRPAGAIFVIHDIDDEKRALAALRDSEERFRTLADSIPQLAWLAEPDGSIYWYNRRWYDFTGTTLEEVRGAGWRRVHHADHVDRVAAGFQRAVTAGETWEDTLPLRGKNGTYRWFLSRALPIRDAGGRVVRWFGTNTDVTEQREAEAALQRVADTLEQRVAERTEALDRIASERSQLASIVENSSELIAVADAKLRILYLNEAGRRLVGLDSLEVARQTKALQYFFPNDRKKLAREIFPTLRERGRWAGELSFRHFKTGARIPVLYDIFRIDDPASGQPARFATLSRDLTERNRAEEALQQAQKMEAVGQLTGGVAHDFNNLLTAILGSLELLEPRLADDASRRLLRTAQRGAERGAELTAQLLAFSRKQRLAPEVLDINRLIRGMDDLLRRTIGVTVEIRRSLADDLWPVLVDSSHIEVAILNLALNARDAMMPGGVLTIGTRNIAAAAALPAEVAGKDCVAIAVTDTGTGMTEEVAARAFDPFFTTKEVGKGSGLGLSQVYGVVRQSGGAVDLRSRPGKGTTIELLLPRAPAAAPRHRDAEEAPAASRGGSARILLVDDDPDVRAMSADMLRELGHDVSEAASGREALAFLDHGLACELLVIDLAMPGINGADAAAMARRSRPDLAVLFATGYADADVFGDQVGDARVIRKPFTLSELGQAVGEALQYGPGSGHRAG